MTDPDEGLGRSGARHGRRRRAARWQRPKAEAWRGRGEAGVVLVELGGGVAGRHDSAKGRVRIEERVSSGGARGGGGDVRDREKREGIERWEGRRERRRCGKGSRERWHREGEEMGSLPALGLAGEWALGGRPNGKENGQAAGPSLLPPNL